VAGRVEFTRRTGRRYISVAAAESA
jgi:hypothetical protein